MAMHVRWILFSIIALSMAGCLPMHHDVNGVCALRCVDGVSGDAVSPVLVVPMYHSENGFFSSDKEKDGKGHEFLAQPFLCDGRAFALNQVHSRGLGMPAIGIGRWRTLHGVFIIAPGYRTRFLPELTRDRIRLEPLDVEEAVGQIERATQLLKQNRIPREDAIAMGLASGTKGPVRVVLQPAEIRMVKGFLDRSLAKVQHQVRQHLM